MKKLLLYLFLIFASFQTWATVSGPFPASSSSNPIKSLEWDAKIYPNPNNGVFSIMVIDNAAAIEVVVFNVIGEKVFQLTALGDHGAKIDLSNLDKGLYFVQFIDEVKGEVLTRRMYLE